MHDIVKRHRLIDRLIVQRAQHHLPERGLEVGDQTATEVIMSAKREGIKIGPNVVHNVAAARLVESVVQCAHGGCNRTIVNYGEGLPDSRHSRGISDVAQTAIITAVGHGVFSLQNCNHHGGETV